MVWTSPVTDFSSEKFDQKSRKIFVDIQRNYVSSSAAEAGRVFNNNEYNNDPPVQQWRCGRGCSERAWVRQKLCTLNVVKLLLQDKNNKMFSTKIIKVCCSLFIIYWKQAAPAAADRCYIQPSAYITYHTWQ